MKLKIKCQECHGEGVHDYDNNEGFAVQSNCDTCDGKGHFVIETVSFCEFAEAFQDFHATPIYDEKAALSPDFHPFELQMKFNLIGGNELKAIASASESLGMAGHIINRSETGIAFYFTNK